MRTRRVCETDFRPGDVCLNDDGTPFLIVRADERRHEYVWLDGSPTEVLGCGSCVGVRWRCVARMRRR